MNEQKSMADTFAEITESLSQFGGTSINKAEILRIILEDRRRKPLSIEIFFGGISLAVAILVVGMATLLVLRAAGILG